MNPIFSASIMCMDFLNVERDMKILNETCDMYHADIMDGHYAPNITLSPSIIKSIRKATKLPIDAHMMVEKPKNFLEAVADAGADYISVHAETINVDAFRTMSRIRSLGCRFGIVLNPATPVSYIQDYIEEIDLLTIMTVDIGYGGQPFIKQMVPKIKVAAQLKRENNYRYILQIDGSCNPGTYQILHEAGAEAYVMGSTGLFRKGLELRESALRMREEFFEKTGAFV